MSIDESALFAEIQQRWDSLNAWGLGKRQDMLSSGPNGPGDTPPWNLKWPPVLDRIKRWNAFHDVWTQNRSSLSEEERIRGLYRALYDATVAEWASRHAMPDGYQADVTWKPIAAPPILDALGYPWNECGYNAAMHVDITPAAEQAMSTLRARWADLDKWGVRTKLPQDWEQIDRWSEFNCKWNYDPQIGELNAASSALTVVEGDARDLGYKADKPEEPPVATPTVDQGTYTGQAQKKVTDLPDVAGSVWGSIPWYYKAGGAAVLILLAVGAARR